MSDISNRIDNLLLKNKIRRSDLVRAIGIGESTIRGWVNKTPSAEAAVKVAKYFGVSVEWLITGQDNSDKENKNNLSQAELELITISRRLNQRDRDYLQLTARSLISRHENELSLSAPEVKTV